MNKAKLDGLMLVVKDIENMIEGHDANKARSSEELIMDYINALSHEDQGSLITTLLLLIATLANSDEKGEKPGTFSSAVLTARRIQDTLDRAWKEMDMDMIKSGVICMTNPTIEPDLMHHMECVGNA